MTQPFDVDLDAVTLAYSRYWSEVDPQYPVIHRPTYRPSTSPHILNACIFACGDILSHGRARSAILVPVLRCALVSVCGPLFSDFIEEADGSSCRQ